jgi:nucleotide-binding universal stress UspA family protein
MTAHHEPPIVPPPYEHLVGTVVGSSFYEIVAAGSRLLASATGATLHLVHVGRAGESPERIMRTLLEQRLSSLVPGCPPEWLDGDAAHPAAAIDRYLASLGQGIASVASHGYRGLDLLAGSVTEDLLAGGRPLLVFGLAALPTRPQRVAVCLDGSPWAEQLLPEAARWAHALGVPLWLVQGVRAGTRDDREPMTVTAHLRQLAERWRSTGGAVEWEVVHDPRVGRGLEDWLNDEPATLTVAATHGRSGLKRAMLGGVANRLIRHACGPLVLQLLR